MFGVEYLESNIRKTCEDKNLNFFEATGKFPYFDMLKNGSRGSNRLGIKNRSSSEATSRKSQQHSC